MAELAQLNLRAKGRAIRLRALLGDLVQAHINYRSPYPLALAVWYRQSFESDDQYLLELMASVPFEGNPSQDRLSLLWQSGSEGAPYANVVTMSVPAFTEKLRLHPEETRVYQESFEVIYSDKKLLTPEIIEMFRIVTEPTGLMKGWYLPEKQYDVTRGLQFLLSSIGNANPELGLVKIEESSDFENCRGVVQIKYGDKWLPVSADAIKTYTFFNDWQRGLPVRLMFEGGSLYEIVKFEVKTEPELADRLLGSTPDDRYPEVYLRALHPSARTAA